MRNLPSYIRVEFLVLGRPHNSCRSSSASTFSHSLHLSPLFWLIPFLFHFAFRSSEHRCLPVPFSTSYCSWQAFRFVTSALTYKEPLKDQACTRTNNQPASTSSFHFIPHFSLLISRSIRITVERSHTALYPVTHLVHPFPSLPFSTPTFTRSLSYSFSFFLPFTTHPQDQRANKLFGNSRQQTANVQSGIGGIIFKPTPFFVPFFCTLFPFCSHILILPSSSSSLSSLSSTPPSSSLQQLLLRSSHACNLSNEKKTAWLEMALVCWQNSSISVWALL